MQTESVFSGAHVPDMKAAIRAVRERVTALADTALRPIKALGARLSSSARQPWFFPLQSRRSWACCGCISMATCKCP